MANEYVVNRNDLLSVANAIRSKVGTDESLIFPNEFISSIDEVYDAGSDSGYAEGYEKGRVDFSVPTQEKTIDIIANETVSITPDEGYVLSKVTANVNVKTDDGAESKLAQVIGRTVTEITAQDLDGITSVERYAFSHCSALSKLEVPDTVQTIALYACQYISITEFICPESLTDIDTGVFNACNKLKKVIFNENLKKFGNQVFNNCTSLEELDFSKCTTVPRLNNINAFNNIPSTCIMKIPVALFEEWKAATNWSTYADYMVAV